jgi:hypothetical protein
MRSQSRLAPGLNTFTLALQQYADVIDSGIQLISSQCPFITYQL